MAGSTFQTNPFDLHQLLDDCHRGVLQLPDFQRSWVWDEDRVKSLIASISRAFNVGALILQPQVFCLLPPPPRVGWTHHLEGPACPSPNDHLVRERPPLHRMTC